MNCFDCPWFDKKERWCIKYDRKVRLPGLPKSCSRKIPEMALNYLKATKEFTGLPEEKILQSEGFKEFLRKMKEVKI